MAKSVGTARSMVRAWNRMDWDDTATNWWADSWPTYLWACRYLRRHAQRRDQRGRAG